jgi:hypothetical protein
MKLPIQITIILLLFVFSLNGQDKQKNDILGFNRFLGKEKSEALNEVVVSFDKFLELNYPKEKDNSKRIILLLKESFPNFNNQNHSTKIFTTSKNIVLLESLEKSGLRKEIWLYHHEIEKYKPKSYNNIKELFPYQEPELDSIYHISTVFLDDDDGEMLNLEIDSVEWVKSEKRLAEMRKNSLSTNFLGDFLFGLAKFTAKDSFIQNYVETRVLVGDISQIIFIPALLEENTDFNDPFIKRMLVVEFYFWLIREDIRQNE